MVRSASKKKDIQTTDIFDSIKLLYLPVLGHFLAINPIAGLCKLRLFEDVLKATLKKDLKKVVFKVVLV